MDTNVENLQKYYNTTQAAEKVEVARTTLISWIQQLEELVQFEVNDRNHKVFTEENVKLFEYIKQGRDNNVPMVLLIENLRKSMPKEEVALTTKTDNEQLLMAIQKRDEKIDQLRDLIENMNDKMDGMEDRISQRIIDKMVKQREQENPKLQSKINEYRDENKELIKENEKLKAEADKPIWRRIFGK